MGANKLYANSEKSKPLRLGQSEGHRKTDLRKWLALANYFHKDSAGYAELTRPLDEYWIWEQQHQGAFDSIKASLQHAPVLTLPDEKKLSTSYVKSLLCNRLCAIAEPKDTGRNYPAHDKELRAMKYTLVKFRVHLSSPIAIVIYIDRASLRTATNSPQLLQRMARWQSFFAEYNFRVEYKPGKLNVLADALSRRPDYELAHRIRLAYQGDKNYTPLVRFVSGVKDANADRLSPRQRA
ncbi:Reverse transcriptase [Phytophthora palmivora]|uniref:Reverse transcriptase n=1 Tax=Phytophthora palmivora TaxID=4796 RepID=A0A2P4Y126_9STRA|nr:Reverse transcriptase [Phytophthora palmivora]